MNFLKPSAELTEAQTQKGLKFIVRESLAGEVMVNLTGGTFLVSMAVFMGASNFQIGLLASLPIFTNVFQLLSVWLVHKYNNRRAVAVVTSFIARLALVFIGLIPFIFGQNLNVNFLIGLLTLHYFFGSLASASWSSWMKDLVPEKILGQYFSHRTRLMQILSVTSNLLIACFVDFMKSNHPGQLSLTYFLMFLAGSAVGMLGVYLLSRAPEPKATVEDTRVIKSFSKPLKDRNFRRLIVFNSVWSFAIDLAIPFFSVYMMKELGLSLFYVMGFTIIGQLSSIVSVKIWGRYTDWYSNKTIIRICAPVYVLSILAMAFTSLPTSQSGVMILLIAINIFSGISTAGINLAIGNIGINQLSFRKKYNCITICCECPADRWFARRLFFTSSVVLEYSLERVRRFNGYPPDRS